MFKLVSIVFSLAAAVLAVFTPARAWAIIAIPELFLIWTRFTQTWPSNKNSYPAPPDLSLEAAVLFEKYRHYYYKPFANSDLAAAANALIPASAILLIIGLFRSFWWGFALAVPNALILANLAHRFSPRINMSDREMDAHKEVASRIWADRDE
jgi:hypothetical protein